MSHQKERTDRTCLNCGTEVAGRFCQVCGQENIEPKESIWHLITHFFNDITHFDGKFFRTLGLLLVKPGMLSAEYMKGRRMKYLNPVRMYVFTSFVFFLIFFNLFSPKDWDFSSMDSQKKASSINPVNQLRDSILNNLRKDSVIGNNKIKVSSKALDSYSSRKEYDSIQASLPENERHGWLLKRIIYRKIKASNEYGGNQGWVKNLINKFIHSFPYILFVSLPLLALFLKLLYIRRKQFYFTDHGIFLVHLYIFTFIIILITLGLSKLADLSGWSIFNYIIVLLFIYGHYYAIVAMKRFYQQGWRKTLLKFFIFNFLSFFATLFLFLLFLGMTVFQV